jgi:hypothetical protein
MADTKEESVTKTQKRPRNFLDPYLLGVSMGVVPTVTFWGSIVFSVFILYLLTRTYSNKRVPTQLDGQDIGFALSNASFIYPWKEPADFMHAIKRISVFGNKPPVAYYRKPAVEMSVHHTESQTGGVPETSPSTPPELHQMRGEGSADKIEQAAANIKWAPWMNYFNGLEVFFLGMVFWMTSMVFSLALMYSKQHQCDGTAHFNTGSMWGVGIGVPLGLLMLVVGLGSRIKGLGNFTVVLFGLTLLVTGALVTWIADHEIKKYKLTGDLELGRLGSQGIWVAILSCTLFYLVLRMLMILWVRPKTTGMTILSIILLFICFGIFTGLFYMSIFITHVDPLMSNCYPS